ncbi:hypothetical protein I312_102873 [Cryptococcus bacillisporus CA1280]|uniref:uncharacterized protein n=1 Tax=Cryptococcus bacillisporus CA1280 TaxID=1296109 RepID=UPI003366245F
MACEASAVSTLYSTSTTYVSTIIITSTPVVTTPSPSTSLWTTLSCTTSTSRQRDSGFQNLPVSASATRRRTIQSSQLASEGDLVYTTSRTTKPDATSKMVKKAGTEVEDILIESGQAENSGSGVWGVLASNTRQEPGQLSFLYSKEAKVSDLQVGIKLLATLLLFGNGATEETYARDLRVPTDWR